jgi:hypothetical protein
VFAPLHHIIGEFLKGLPNDGTFNQTRSYERARLKSIAFGCSFGFDLSAATDRLPIALQVPLVAALIEMVGFPKVISSELAGL